MAFPPHENASSQSMIGYVAGKVKKMLVRHAVQERSCFPNTRKCEFSERVALPTSSSPCENRETLVRTWSPASRIKKQQPLSRGACAGRSATLCSERELPCALLGDRNAYACICSFGSSYLCMKEKRTVARLPLATDPEIHKSDTAP